MKKVKLMMTTLMMCLMTSVVFGQWTYEMDTDYYRVYPHAYTETIGFGLEMEDITTHIGTTKINRPILYLRGSYFCDDYIYIDFVLVVNGVNKKYKLIGIRSRDGRMYWFDESIWTDEFIKDFKSASKCSIRVNQDYCTDDYYQFDFSGSAAAYDFITK